MGKLVTEDVSPEGIAETRGEEKEAKQVWDFRQADILSVWESAEPVDKGWLSEGGGLYQLEVRNAENGGAQLPEQREEQDGGSKSSVSTWVKP